MYQRLRKTISAGFTLAIRSIRVEIQQHALGYAWTLIIPVLYAVCYIFVKRELSGGAHVHSTEASWGVLRAFTGMTLFQFWIQVVQEMSGLIRNQRGMLRGLNIGPAPFILAIVFEGFISLLIRTMLIIVAVPVVGLNFPPDLAAWLWLAAALALLFLSAVAVGLILAPWAALYADVRKALTSLNMPLVLISPVFYAAVERTDSLLYWINIINPIASPLAVIADAFHGKAWPYYAVPMLCWTALSMAIIAWSVAQLRRQIPILLERIGS